MLWKAQSVHGFVADIFAKTARDLSAFDGADTVDGMEQEDIFDAVAGSILVELIKVGVELVLVNHAVGHIRGVDAGDKCDVQRPPVTT